MPQASTGTGRPSIGATIRRRLEQLGRYGNKTRMAHESGVSDTTWQDVLNDRLYLKQPDKKIAVARYCNWPDDALDRLYAGDDPDTLSTVEWAFGQDASIQEVWTVLSDLKRRVATLEGGGG